MKQNVIPTSYNDDRYLNFFADSYSSFTFNPNTDENVLSSLKKTEDNKTSTEEDKALEFKDIKISFESKKLKKIDFTFDLAKGVKDCFITYSFDKFDENEVTLPETTTETIYEVSDDIWIDKCENKNSYSVFINQNNGTKVEYKFQCSNFSKFIDIGE